MSDYMGCDCGGEHRTLGARAWCYDCSEYCYPKSPCEKTEHQACAAERDSLTLELHSARQIIPAAAPNCTPRCGRCLAMGPVDATDGLCDPCHTIRLLVLERDRAEAENARLQGADQAVLRLLARVQAADALAEAIEQDGHAFAESYYRRIDAALAAYRASGVQDA